MDFVVPQQSTLKAERNCTKKMKNVKKWLFWENRQCNDKVVFAGNIHTFKSRFSPPHEIMEVQSNPDEEIVHTRIQSRWTVDMETGWIFLYSTTRWIQLTRTLPLYIEALSLFSFDVAINICIKCIFLYGAKGVIGWWATIVAIVIVVVSSHRGSSVVVPYLAECELCILHGGSYWTEWVWSVCVASL